MRVTCLASGSSGNALLVCADDARMIIDCGFSARRLAGELWAVGVHPSELQAIFLSHEHSDHVGSVSTFSRRHHIPVIANEATLRALGPAAPVLAELMPTGTTLNIGPLSVTSFPVPHDARETIGFFLQHGEDSICIATDLGEVPAQLIEYLRASDLMILEANHDVDLLINGPYPSYLKQRVIGRNGHLSNADSAAAAVEAASGKRQWLWLAHLSAVNNTPRLALKTIKERIEQEGISSIEVAVALRDKRSLVWDSSIGVQGRMDL